MHIPAGLTEAEVLDAIEAVVSLLDNRYKLPGVDRDDMGQEIRLLCLEALPRYSPERGKLGGFLYQHSKNRLMNAMRDRVQRREPYCKRCAADDFCRPDGEPCKRHLRWKQRNARKRGLAAVLPTDRGPDLPDLHDHVAEVDAEDLRAHVERNLTPDVRLELGRILGGERVPWALLEQVRREARAILARQADADAA